MRIGHGWRSRYLASGVVLGALLAAALASPSSAASYGLEQTLYRFCAQSNCVDGANPSAGLIMDAAGNLYGTTKLGNNPNGYGNVGVVFELTPTSSGWAETVLYNFCSQGGGSCVDGSQPQAGLIMDTAGNLYGTTYSGGGVGNPGVVFELTPSGNGWKETVLYRFCAQADCADGRNPTAGLIMDAAGNLYGTTSYGGKASPLCTGGTGCGVAFELIPNQQKTAWTETVLYEFCSQSNCADGAIASQNPTAGLIMDGAGNLYGTTVNGGTIVANICNDGCGVVFELTPNQQKTAWTQTVLYGFCSQFDCADGSQPTAGLIMDAAGNLYGTTSNGGDENDGTVFELMPSQQNTTWTETVLHSFGSVAGDGTHPYASLIMDRAGNIYGTTFGNGIGGGAKVFELLPDGGGWTERALYAFCSQTNCADGGYVEAGLIMDAAGDLYGTGYQGGNQGKGVVFELVPAPLYAKQADFNGDGKGDILWRYTDGTVAMWEMNGASVLAPVGGQIIPNTWEIAGTGDFDGDGKSDILWRYVDGSVAVWLMNGGTVVSSLGAGVAAAGWRIVGTGDFDGDGETDILWEYTDGTLAIWFMNGGTVASIVNIGAAAAGSEVVGTGDFNGDGKADILWHHSDGSVALWLMNGGTVTASLAVGSAPAGWTIVGTGDFNGDGKSDILWMYSDGSVATWLMNGATVTSSLGVGVAAPDWLVAGTADFNGDGKTDILWHYATGTAAIWLMNGGAVSLSSDLGAGSAPTSWAIVE